MTGSWVVPAADFAATPVWLIGGKAAGLGALIAVSAPVPAGFCITTTARRAATLRPSAVDSQVRDNIARLRAAGVTRFAVRSSHTWEDTAEAISPGVYHSEVGLTDDGEILDAVRRVWASASTPAAIDYRRSRGVSAEPLAMAVLVQEAPVAAVGGVLYTVLPDEGDPTAVLIEYAAGGPTGVTEGHGIPHRQVVAKRDPQPLAADPRLLTPAQLATLVSYSLRLERRLDAPIDLEWLVTEAGEVRMLQARRLPYPAVDPTGPYTVPARHARLRSDKLAPFRLADRLDLATVEAHIIMPAAFAAFAAAGGATPEPVLRECRRVFRHYVEHGPVSIRSVYWSALSSGDMLAQSPELRSVERCVEHLESCWRQVLDGRRNDYTAEIAFQVSNWVRPRASVIATASGGSAVLGALYGMLEGLETCTHDTYEIDLPTRTVQRASTPHKAFAVLTAGRPPEPVPQRLRDRAVLTDDEIRAVSRDVARIAAHAGGARVEMLVPGDGAPPGAQAITWQVAEGPSAPGLRYYSVRPAERARPGAGAVASGVLTPVRRPEETSLDATRLADSVVVLDLERFELRDPQRTAALAALLREAGRPVVVKGSLLSHFAALLREYGVSVYPVNELPPELAPGTPVEVIPV